MASAADRREAAAMTARAAGRAVNDNAPTLNPAERSKLAGILSRLDSSFEGERDAAALAASRFVKARALDWHTVLSPVAMIEALRFDLDDWRAIVRELQRLGIARNDFERRFLASLPAFRTLSQKQRALLASITERVGLDL